MLSDLARREKVTGYLRTFKDYPLEIVQCLPVEISMLRRNIGEYEFSTLLLDVSHSVRNNLVMDPEWDVRVRRGSAVHDSDSLAALQILYALVTDAKMNVHHGFFPYELTKTPEPNVICYRKLQGLKLTEYVAELLDPSYKRPQFLNIPLSDSDAISHLVEHSSAVSY